MQSLVSASSATHVQTSPHRGVFLCAYELPYLITLDSPRLNVTDIAVMELGTGDADLRNQLEDGIEGNIAHPGGCAERVSFD